MLRINDLVKIYPGPVAALKGVSLDIPEGLFGLLGPNGAGKSTLMNILAGLLEPTGGTVTLDGTDIVTDPRAVWGRLGYLPQDFGFYPSLSGAQMLDFLLRLKGVDAPQGRKRLVEELLDRVNLAHAARRKVRTYSGGMRQRLGIAQAIAGNPRLVIVDEPTAGLDPEERQRFYRILAELGRDRIVLLSTHIVEDIATLCPRFAVIRGGRCVTSGGTSDARRRLDGRVFEGIVEPAALERIRASHRVTQAVLVEGSMFRTRVQGEAGQQPAGFVPVPPTLEDVYFGVMDESRASDATRPVAAA
ncbi:MAG: ABC transporter ATP-binding protein [Planctomycetes bacterium]|jgi:ABC-type multidrug transport system ATPase subunit|nr:ABC transporter ATP-binding protein [Planctomycetota bacterium]